MNWDAIGAIGEWVGAAAVIATLFYLARQIRDSTQQAKMASVAELNALYNDCFLPIYNSRENMEIWTKGLATPDVLDETEREIFSLFMRRLLNPFDTAITQHQGGTLAHEHFERYRLYTEEILASPGGKAFIATGAVQLTSEARKIVGLGEDGSA